MHYIDYITFKEISIYRITYRVCYIYILLKYSSSKPFGNIVYE